MANELSQARLANWVSMIRDQKASGHSVPEWCREHDVTENQYYYWLRNARKTVLATVQASKEEISESAEPEFVKVDLPLMEPPQQVSDTNDEIALQIQRGRLKIEVRNDASDRILRFLKEVILSC